MLNTKFVTKNCSPQCGSTLMPKKVSIETKTYDIEPSLNVGRHLGKQAYPEKCIKQFPNFIGKMVS